MARVNRGESAVLSCVIKDIDGYGNVGNQVNPGVVPVIFIYDPHDTLVVNGSSMTFIETGLYTYNHAVATDAAIGRWKFRCKVQDGTLVTYQEDYFTVGR